MWVLRLILGLRYNVILRVCVFHRKHFVFWEGLKVCFQSPNGLHRGGNLPSDSSAGRRLERLGQGYDDDIVWREILQQA